MNQIYKMSTYRSTYETFNSHRRSTSSFDCLAPLISQRSGRPKAKRQERKQKKNARISRCTFCKSRNHTIDEDVIMILSPKGDCETAATAMATIRKIASL